MFKKIAAALFASIALLLAWQSMSTVPQPESTAGSVRPSPAVTYKEQKPAQPSARPAPSTPAAATIEDRVHALADSRDPAEYLEVYQLIEECLELERSKEIEKVEVKKVRKEGKDEFEVETSKLSGDELEAKRKSCATMSGRTRLDRFELLKYAADCHAPGAIALYMYRGPNGDLAALLERRDDPQVAAWRKEVTAKLQEGIDLGYPDALLQAFSGYAILGNEPTAADAYAIGLASNKVIGAINQDDGPYRQRSLDDWSAALTPQQRSEAQNKAERIFQNWKQRTGP